MLKVSVIIPVYNAEAYLRQCLDSVVNQTLQDIEIICVDDGSADFSTVILNEYAAKDARINIFTQVNSGQGAARNRGLEAARGEYVYFVDADDELLNTSVLENLLATAKRENLDVLFFDAETVIDEGFSTTAVRAGDYVRHHDYSSVMSGRELFSEFLKNREYTVCPYLAFYRRSFLEENNIRFPSERIFYEDNIFMTRVLLAAKRASHRPWRFYLRKVHAGSTVTSKPTIIYRHPSSLTLTLSPAFSLSEYSAQISLPLYFALICPFLSKILKYSILHLLIITLLYCTTRKLQSFCKL